MSSSPMIALSLPVSALRWPPSEPRAAAALHRRPRAEFARRGSGTFVPRLLGDLGVTSHEYEVADLPGELALIWEGSGTRISPRHILTAAHLFLRWRAPPARRGCARVGDTRRDDWSTATRAPCAPPRCTPCAAAAWEVPTRRRRNRISTGRFCRRRSSPNRAPPSARASTATVRVVGRPHRGRVWRRGRRGRAAVDRTRRRRRDARRAAHAAPARVARRARCPAGADLIDCFGQPATVAAAARVGGGLALERFSWRHVVPLRRRLRRPAARRLRHRRRRRVLRRRAGGGGRDRRVRRGGEQRRLHARCAVRRLDSRNSGTTPGAATCFTGDAYERLRIS